MVEKFQLSTWRVISTLLLGAFLAFFVTLSLRIDNFWLLLLISYFGVFGPVTGYIVFHEWIRERLTESRSLIINEMFTLSLGYLGLNVLYHLEPSLLVVIMFSLAFLLLLNPLQ